MPCRMHLQSNYGLEYIGKAWNATKTGVQLMRLEGVRSMISKGWFWQKPQEVQASRSLAEVWGASKKTVKAELTRSGPELVRSG